MARILVVDDDALMRALYRRCLPEHDVTVCEEAQLALDLALRGGTFDVFIIDFELSDRDGAWVYEQLLRECSPLARRVLFATGSSEAATHLATQQPVMAKPFRIKELREHIDRLSRGGMEGAS